MIAGTTAAGMTATGIIAAGMTATVIVATIADGTEIIAGIMIDGIAGVTTTIGETGGDTTEATDSSRFY
jgi:hypothetical protein